MSSTYLELTNSAIVEAGCDIDELNSSNFLTSTDPLHKRFRRWINQSLKEIEFERNQWEYKNKQAQTVIYPRWLVIDGDRSVAPPADSTFEGDDTGVTFTVVSTTLLDGAWGDGDAVALIDYLDLSGEPAFNELFDETAPTPANLNVFRLKWFGRYDLDSTTADIQEINKSTFSIQSASGLTDTTLNTGSTDNGPLQYMPWDQFNVAFENEAQFGKPYIITETPDGWYDFFPRPNVPYVLTFSYQASPQTLTTYDSTVTDMPALYQDAIVWRAVMYYADYDRKPDLFARAERRYEYYKNRAEANLMPTPSFGFNRYSISSY